MTTSTDPGHYLPDPVHRRLLAELIALQANRGRGVGDPLTWAVKFLGIAGIWSDGILAEENALEVPAVV